MNHKSIAINNINDEDRNSLTYIQDNLNDISEINKLNNINDQVYSPVKKKNKKLPSPIQNTKKFQNKMEEEYFCEYEYDSHISQSLRLDELNNRSIIIYDIYNYR